MGRRFDPHPILVSAVFLAIAFGGGCLTPPPKLRDPVLFVSPDLGRIRPVELVVLPVRSSSPVPQARLDLFRREVVLRLIERKYSPVALAYVDDVLHDAANRAGGGSIDSIDAVLPLFQEDAVLAVTVRTFDRTRMSSEGIVRLGADAWLYERSTGNRLWMSQIDQEVPVRRMQQTGQEEEAVLAWAVRQFTKDLFGSLPEKVPPEGVRERKEGVPTQARLPARLESAAG